MVLSGCGSADVAATFDGRTVTEQQVADAVRDINKAFQLQEPYTPQRALTSLIRAPYLIEYGQAHGNPQTESGARAQLNISNPSPATLEIIRAEGVIGGLTADDEKALTDQLAKLVVDVNPKYGEFNPNALAVTPSLPSWIEPPAGP